MSSQQSAYVDPADTPADLADFLDAAASTRVIR
jgi:hypothetical protein